ncbi:hypothetical protein WOLCODRAFT_165651 [Wolfiporia cocos MD-104 SS10]|uniref:Uncharacterized protein n=1 Tax=Wolfiporia cocos (strain MD-104) TaxID=742152 RepID=A0A2H3JEX6_WOLCO|nr:hypothetical protein WOLCODRAFT_165651 [Wolfiporia cocos MD-104 SS10]
MGTKLGTGNSNHSDDSNHGDDSSVDEDINNDEGSNTGEGNEAMDVDVDAQPFHNPFDNLPQSGYDAACAIVIGSPGIGKSVFLIYVLVLRLLAGLTTIFQRRANELYVLNDEGVFRVTSLTLTSSHLHLYVPSGTWCLVDSNQGLTGVPEDVVELRSAIKGFILQAASPCAERVHWTNKVRSRVPRFWMARWSLGELIIGRDLQYWETPQQKPSEAQLAKFAICFGTSARRAYSCAANPAEYKDRLYGKIETLNRRTLPGLLNHYSARVMDDTISHDILVATPSPRNRKKFDLQIVTGHLWTKVLQQLNRTDAQAADMLYQLFVGDPHTRASAGYLLERAFLVEFPKGGEWPITAMTMSPRSGKTGTHWRSHATKSKPLHKYLRLGYQGRIVAIANDQIDTPVKAFDRLDRCEFSLGESLILEERFYIPRSRSQLSFDGFVYEAVPQRATIFQVTVSTQRPISTKGLDWLHDCGAKSLRLFVVTSPLDDGVVEDIWVANSHKDKLDEVYHLELSSLKCTVKEVM